jgi:hypothetical protein
MSDEIQDIETLIKQTGELCDSLIPLIRKLQERSRQQAQHYEERGDNLSALNRKLTELRFQIDLVQREIGPQQHYNQGEAYLKAHLAVLHGTGTPEEAVIELLRLGVADKTISTDVAVEQLIKLLCPDLPVSRRIEIRETVKAAFETGDDVLGRVRPFLKGNQQKQTEQQTVTKTIAVTPNN